MAVHFDVAAELLVADERRHRPADSVLIMNMRRLATRGVVEAITFAWACETQAAGERAICRAADVAGVPVYMHLRLWRYFRWRDVTVTAARRLWSRELVVPGEVAVLFELQRWEESHPGLLRDVVGPEVSAGARPIIRGAGM